MSALFTGAGPHASGKHARSRAVNYARVRQDVHQPVIERWSRSLRRDVRADESTVGGAALQVESSVGAGTHQVEVLSLGSAAATRMVASRASPASTPPVTPRTIPSNRAISRASRPTRSRRPSRRATGNGAGLALPAGPARDAAHGYRRVDPARTGRRRGRAPESARPLPRAEPPLETDRGLSQRPSGSSVAPASAQPSRAGPACEPSMETRNTGCPRRHSSVHAAFMRSSRTPGQHAIRPGFSG